MGMAWVTWPNFEILGPPNNFWTIRAIRLKFGANVEDWSSLPTDYKTTVGVAGVTWRGHYYYISPTADVWTMTGPTTSTWQATAILNRHIQLVDYNERVHSSQIVRQSTALILLRPVVMRHRLDLYTEQRQTIQYRRTIQTSSSINTTPSNAICNILAL